MNKLLAPLLCLSSVLLPACAATARPPAVLGETRTLPLEPLQLSATAWRWRVGELVAEGTTRSLALARGRQDLCDFEDRGLGWQLQVREPAGRAWSATCAGSSYAEIERLAGCTTQARGPIAAACAVDASGETDPFRLELTWTGPDADVGRWLDPRGHVTLDRAALPDEPSDVPRSLLVRVDGLAAGWLQLGQRPRLEVPRDLDPVRQRAVERAALLALSLDQHAPARLHGDVVARAPWSRSASPECRTVVAATLRR